MKAKSLNGAYENVNFAATYTNGRRQNLATSKFEIEELAGYFDGKRLESKVVYENFEDPNVDVRLDGVIPVKALYGLFENPMINAGSGEVEVNALTINGRLEDLQNPSRLAQINSGGAINFQGASINLNQDTLSVPSGTFKLEDQVFTIDQFRFVGAGTDLQFDGSAYNVIPILFADAENSKNAELEFSATLKAKTVDFDRLMNLTLSPPEGYNFADPNTESAKKAKIQQRARTTNFLRGQFNAVIDTINYQKVVGHDFAGRIDLINNEMLLKGELKTMGGRVEMDGQVFFEDAPRMKTKFIANNIIADTLFRQMENFGQTVLTADNLKGRMNTKAVVYGYWDENGRFMEDKLRVLAGVGIANGQLENLEMLRQFSTFIKVEDLMNINFSNLENYLEYRKQKLYIPVMFIQSNALNLIINGEHTYDNQIKYNLKVNAGQVLTNKLKRHDPNLQPLKARKEGFFNLYYTIFGDLEQYDIRSAKRQIKKEFDISSMRKRDLRVALEEEFGQIKLVEEPTAWRDIPEYEDEVTADPDNEEFLDFELEEEVADTTKSNEGF